MLHKKQVNIPTSVKKLSGTVTFALNRGSYLILRVNTKWLYIRKKKDEFINPFTVIGQDINCSAHPKTVKNQEVYFLKNTATFKPAKGGWEDRTRKILRAAGYRKIAKHPTLTPPLLWDLFWKDRLDIYTLIGSFYSHGFPLNNGVVPAAVVHFGAELYRRNKHYRTDLLVRTVKMFLHLLQKDVSQDDVIHCFSNSKVKEKLVFTDSGFYPTTVYYQKQAVLDKIKNHTKSATYSNIFDALENNKYVAITGKAGAGKTTLIKNLPIKIFKVGTTGKAAQRFDALMTVHKLLNFDGVSFKGITYDWIEYLAIDESSMLTWDMLYELVCGKSSKHIGKIIFIGDPEQLPPPQGEPAFPEILSILPKVVLTQTYRGKMNTHEIRFTELKSMLNCIKTLILKSIKENKTWQVLCPVYQAYPGIDMLNEFLERVVPAEHRKVIVKKNIYDADNQLQVVNGTVGVIINSQENGFITIRSENNKVYTVSKKVLQPACCLSIHKAQGSEWDKCILVIPKKYQIDRETFQTGTTRAKEVTYILRFEE